MKRIIAVLVCCVMVGVTGCGSSTGAASTASKQEPVDLAKINKDDFIKGYTELYKTDEGISIEIVETLEKEADKTPSGKAEIKETYDIKNTKGEKCSMILEFDKKTKMVTSILFNYKNEKMPDLFNTSYDSAVKLISAKSWDTLAWDYKSFADNMLLEYEINGVYYTVFYDDGSSVTPNSKPSEPCSTGLIIFGKR